MRKRLALWGQKSGTGGHRKEADMNTQTAHQKSLEQIARQHLLIDGLQTRNSDRLDFKEVAVWEVQNALQAAFEAGQKAAQEARS
jgi:hypothetical protein